MELAEIKRSLGKPVRLVLKRHNVDENYVLSGCILRLNKEKESFFYQAELIEMGTGTVIIAALEDVLPADGKIPEKRN